jgi:hypothetical protein
VNRVEALRVFYQHYLDKYSSKGIIMKSGERWLHWWQEYPTYYIHYPQKELREYTKMLMKKYEIKRQLYNKDYLRSRKNRIRVSKLIKICEELGIPYYEYDKILGYPVDLSNPNLWKLAIHIINEGNIKKEKGTFKIKYYNKDPVLHYYLYLLGGKPIKEKKRAFMTYIPVKYVSKLLKIGVPVGNKTINIPKIDLSAMDYDTWKYYIMATLTEEGSLIIRTTRKTLYLGCIIKISRSIDITKHITNPNKYIKLLGYGYHPLGKVKKKFHDLYKIIIKQPHPYLYAEFKELRKREPSITKYLHLFPESLYISKDNRIKVSWILRISGRKSVKYIFKKYGFLPGSFKEYMGNKYYDIIISYEKNGLTDELRRLIKKLHMTRKDMFDKWIREKEKDYFYRFVGE